MNNPSRSNLTGTPGQPSSSSSQTPRDIPPNSAQARASQGQGGSQPYDPLHDPVTIHMWPIIAESVFQLLTEHPIGPQADSINMMAEATRLDSKDISLLELMVRAALEAGISAGRAVYRRPDYAETGLSAFLTAMRRIVKEKNVALPGQPGNTLFSREAGSALPRNVGGLMHNDEKPTY